MPMINWETIETEYITTDISYRELAKKFGLTNTSVYRHGKNLEWQRKRSDYRSKLQADVMQKNADALLSAQEEIANNVTQAKKNLAKHLREMTENLSEYSVNDQHKMVTMADMLMPEDGTGKVDVVLSWGDGMEDYAD